MEGKLFQRILRGGLLGLFLAAAYALPDDHLAHDRLGRERLLMLAALLADDAVEGGFPRARLDELLQGRLIIPAMLIGGDLANGGHQRVADDAAGGANPPIQIDGGDHGLEGIG